MNNLYESADVSRIVSELFKRTGVIFTRHDIVAAYVLQSLSPDLRNTLFTNIAKLSGEKSKDDTLTKGEPS